MKSFLFEPVVKAFLNNGSRYNLMNSAIIEMFEFIRVEDIKSLTAHVIENYWKALEDVDYVQTFKGLKLRFEQQRERQDNPKLDSMRSILRNHRYRRDARTLEDEEEMWFNTDEDDMEDGEAVVSPSDKTKNDDDIMDPISKFMERKKCMLKQRARETEAFSPGPSFLEKMISGYCEYMISQRLTGCG